MHCENTSDVDVGEFCNALALLRSTEVDSTERLRRMLDACIEKRCGPGSTLAARMPKRFPRDVDEPAAPSNTSKRRPNVPGQGATRNEIWDSSGRCVSVSRTDDTADGRSTMIDATAPEIGYVDCYDDDDEDIPRISIPDEGSTDTTVCKVLLN